MFPSLYSICIDWIVENNEEIQSLEGLPFRPFVYDLIHGMFRSLKPLEKRTLSLIGQAHGPSLVQVPRGWTSLNLSLLTPYGPSEDMLRFVSGQIAMFIVRLDLSSTRVGDEHIHLLRSFRHLQSLELSNLNQLTDLGVIYLATLCLPRLQQLGLFDNRGITDRCLSQFNRLDSLDTLDLTNTEVNPTVAELYLGRTGFTPTERKVDQTRLSFKLHSDIRLMHVPGYHPILPQPEPGKKKARTALGTLYFKRNTFKRKRSPSPQPVKPTLDDYWSLISQEFT